MAGASWEGLQGRLRLAWWELGNKPRPATAGARLVASWERPQFKLRPAATWAGLGAAWQQLQCEPSLVAAYASSRALGKDCNVSQGRPPPIWRVRSMLGINFCRASRLGRGGSLRNAMPGQMVSARLLESDRSGPARWKESITTEQWHLPKFPSPERFTTHPCPSSPTLGLVN